MKKNSLLIILSALALAGCVKENSFGTDSQGLRASIDAGEMATKAILIDNPGISLDSRWQADESIGVFGGSVSNVKFSVSAKDISIDGKTAVFNSGSDIPGGALTAYSPYQSGAEGSGDAIVIDFPAVQNYTRAGGLPQPDPQSNIMVATGSANTGLTFRNALAVLKIGQIFDETTTVKSVQFRDLSGAPVSGKMSLSWNGGSPSAKITGSGESITLDCGDGLQLAAGQRGTFFIIVPAREYPKGIEITFVDSQGGKTVKTAGTTSGKVLERSIVYLIGDITSREPLPGATSTLKPEAQILTPEKLDKIQIIDSKKNYVLWEDGTRVQKPDGTDLRMPTLDMLMHKDLNPVVGNWLVFDEISEELPGGGVYRINSVDKKNDDYFEVVAVPEPNVAAPFEDLKVGEPLVDDNGEMVADGGIPLDITSYISSIVDEQGNNVPFAVSSTGKILLSEETIADIYGVETKSIKNTRFTSPKLSFNTSDDNLEISIGGTLALDARIAVRYMQGEMQYTQFTVTPEIEASLGAVLKLEGNIERSAHIYTINVLPFPIAPGVLITPQLVIHAKVGVGGSLQVSASVKATQKLGTYSLAYNRGDGTTLRWLRPAISNPTEFGFESGGAKGSLYAYGGIGVTTNISIYAMCGLGLDNELTFKFATTYGSDGSLKLALTPEFEVTPSVTCLLGSKKFTDLTGKVEFDPIWERYIRPKSRCTVIPRFNYSDYMDIELDDGNIISTKVRTSVRGIEYQIKMEGSCAEDQKVVLLVFTGSEIKYSPDVFGSDPDGSQLQLYKSSGLEHLYGQVYIVNKQLVNPMEKPHAVIDLGTYPADTETKTFEGIANGTFVSGQAYGVVPAIMNGENFYILSTGGAENYYNPFIYWWPNRSNGLPYINNN